MGSSADTTDEVIQETGSGRTFLGIRRKKKKNREPKTQKLEAEEGIKRWEEMEQK